LILVNSTTLKTTLRTNNRELARALENKKAELNQYQALTLRLRREMQALHFTITTLRTTGPLKDIEAMVDERLEERVQQRIKVRYASGVKYRAVIRR